MFEEVAKIKFCINTFDLNQNNPNTIIDFCILSGLAGLPSGQS